MTAVRGIAIHPDGSVTVTDNGRGIPVAIHAKTGLSGLETVMTRLHAGGKFGGSGYKVASGLHGVGVSAVNALSTWLRVETVRDGRLYFQEYAAGGPKTPIQERGRTDRIGTSTTFLADTDALHLNIQAVNGGSPNCSTSVHTALVGG